MTFKRPPLPPRRQRDPDEFASFTPKSRAPTQLPASEAPIIEAGWLRSVGLKPAPKVQGRVRKDIRESARDEECTVRIAGVCNGRRDTSVWSHWPGIAGGRGMGLKSIDLAGAVACSACHDVVDGRTGLPPGATRESVMLDWFMGHLRSLVLLRQKGLL